MSQLKYIITADDSDFKKKIAEVARLASQSGGKMVADVNKAVETEVAKRKDVTKVIHDQTAAIKERNREEAKRPKVPFEIVRGTEGVITSGTVMSPSDIERAAKANQAFASSAQLAQAGLEKQALSTAKVSTNSVKQIGILESMKDKLNDLKRAQDTTTDPIKIQTYNREIQKTEGEIARMSNAGKVGFDNMGNAIQKSTNLMGKAWSSLRMIANILPGLGIAGLLAFAIDPIMKWVSSMGEATDAQKAFNTVKQESSRTIAKEVAETELLIGKINSNNTSETQRQALLTELINKNPSILSALNLQNIATAEGKGIIDDYIVSLKEKIRLQSIEQGYINAVQKAADARSGMLGDETDLKWYNKVARTIGDITLFRTKADTDKYIEETNKKQREEAGKTYDVIADSLLKQVEAETKSAKKITEIKDTSLRSLEQKLAQTNDRLRTAQAGENTKALQDEKKALEAQISQREKMLGLDKKKAPAASTATATENAAAAMYQRIESLRQEYTRKVMAQDEAEIQSARDKFANLAAEVAKFNANPKNKVKVSTEGIETLRDQVITDLQAKQQAARDAIELEKKEKSLAEALKLAETHEEAIADVQKKYADARKEIGATITADQSAVLDAGLKKDTDALNQSLIEQLDSYQAFFGDLANLSGAKLDTAASKLSEDLADLVVKYPELKKIADIITKQIVSAKTAKTAVDFRDMADSFSFMADSLQDIGGGLADAFRTASNLAGQVSNMKNDMEAFAMATKNGSVAGQMSSGLGIIGAGFNIMSSLNKFMDRTTAADEQRLRNSQLQLEATEGMTKALERQIKIASEAYGTQKIEEYRKAVEQARKTEEEAGKALSTRRAFTGDSDLDKAIEKLNKGEKLSSWSWWGDSEEDHGDRAKRNVKTLTTDIEELQRLLSGGKLDSQTAAIAQNFINAHDAIKESERAIMEFQTGINFDTLSDNLIDAISSGNDAIDELGQNFEDTMRNAILNSLKDGQFKKEMQDWYEAFNAAYEGGFTESELSKLREDYMKIGERQRQQLLAYEQATGMDLDGSNKADSQKSGIKGAFERTVTESTANEWIGLSRATYELQKNHYLEAQSQTSFMKEYTGYAFQNLQTALNIERNTANTVVELQNAVVELKVIAKNTKSSSQSDRDLMI